MPARNWWRPAIRLKALFTRLKKSNEDHGDKVDPATAEAIKLAIAALKNELQSDNVDKIRSGIRNVNEAAMRLGEAIYKARATDE